MARDQKVLEIFEIGDDSFQGLIGYYFYVCNAVGWAPDSGILTSLPPDKIPLTHEWDRFYDPQELITIMRQLFLAYQTRLSIVAVASIFDSVTQSFIERLHEIGKPPPSLNKKESYKKRLKWVFQKVKASKFGNPAMQARIPNLCLDVDHARRIRNISVHNKGLFNTFYETDAIPVGNNQILIHPSYQQFKSNINKPFPLILNPNDYIQVSKSHIELLHFLHYEIQLQDFNDTTPYNYSQQGKCIEWHRVLFGY